MTCMIPRFVGDSPLIILANSIVKHPSGRHHWASACGQAFEIISRSSKPKYGRGHLGISRHHQIASATASRNLFRRGNTCSPHLNIMSGEPGLFGSGRRSRGSARITGNARKKQRTFSGAVPSAVPTSESRRNEGKGRRNQKGKSKGARNEYVGAINMAAKYCDREAAMAAFRGARSEGVKLQQETMNSLLYILVGGDKWSTAARVACEAKIGGNSSLQLEIPESSVAELAETNPEAIAKHDADPVLNIPLKEDDFRNEVFAYMEESEMFNGEMAYTAHARLAACHADEQQALSFLEKSIAANIPSKLRIFTPALLCFAALGQAEGALKIEQMIREQSLELTEMEFQLVLEACSKSGTYSQVSRLLGTIGQKRTYLEASTIEHITNYFQSERAKDAFNPDEPLAGKQMWALKWIDVEPDGYSDFAGGKLAPIDIGKSDWGVFLAGVGRMARDNEKGNNFETYLSWINQHGPFDIIVDGANVAMHGQNFQGAFFRFDQIEAIVTFLEREFPGRRILVILHVGRLHSPQAKAPKARAVIDKLRRNNQLFSTPVGSNDDWYWLYAAIMARESSLVISNDECRDHIFELLTPEYFLKWKERHMVRFSFKKDYRRGLTADIVLPAPYTPCIQELYKGTWMVPCVDGKWLCAKAL